MFRLKQFYLIGLTIVSVMFAVSLFAATDVYEFENDLDRERFKRFTYELRCPKCQSQNLAGSDSSISRDLKRELHRLVVEGKNDEEIIEFMVSRYGEFVLYKPRFQPNTYALWLGPIVLLLIGLLVFGFVTYKKHSRKSLVKDK